MFRLVVNLRLTLIYSGFFGELNLDANLREAYKDFRAWKTSKKLHTSQRIFRPGFVPWAVSQLLLVLSGLFLSGNLRGSDRLGRF